MFRSFIYLDKEKMYTYKRQIEGRNQAQPKSMTQKKNAGFSAGALGINANGGIETSINSDFEQDVSFDYDHFELALQQHEGEDYFDYISNSGYDIATVPSMKIIRLLSSFEVPEAFDMVNMIEMFKPLLMGQFDASSVEEQAAFEAFLGQTSADIPILAEYDDIKIAGKLNSSNLREAYATLDEYESQEVCLLCKVVGMSRKSEVEVFDPLKDFIHLPRSTRRDMEKKGNDIGLGNIIVDGPVLKVEVIAIYK